MCGFVVAVEGLGLIEVYYVVCVLFYWFSCLVYLFDGWIVGLVNCWCVLFALDI